MGVRGELFSTKVSLQNRTYFFNVKENRLGDLYLNIVESKNREEGGFERQSVILFAEDLQEFLKGFDESLRVLEKAAREKRRGKVSGARESDRDSGRDYSQGGHERRDRDSEREPRRSDRDFEESQRSNNEYSDTAERNSGPKRAFRASSSGYGKSDSSRQGHGFREKNEKKYGNPRNSRYGDEHGRKSERAGRGGPDGRRSRFANKDADYGQKPSNPRFSRENGSRKKRVVVKKR